MKTLQLLILITLNLGDKVHSNPGPTLPANQSTTTKAPEDFGTGIKFDCQKGCIWNNCVKLIGKRVTSGCGHPTNSQGRREGHISAQEVMRNSSQLVQDAFVTDEKHLWTGGIIHYSFKEVEYYSGEWEPLFGSEDKQLITRVMQHISDNVPCLQFREVKANTVGSKIIFTTMGDTQVETNYGCWSYVGHRGNVGGENGQSINLGSPDCFNFGSILHEVMHSLGATHEQNRPNRNSHIKVVWDNIEPRKKSNFNKTGSTFNSHSTPYDFQSIMHYDLTDFSVNGKNTLELRDNTRTLRPKHLRTELSPIDIMELGKVYEKLTKETCFKVENVIKYSKIVENIVEIVEKENAALKESQLTPCYEKVESGFFFGPGGGRIRAESRFRVGLDFDITMMIKPRNITGILAAVKGRQDYLILQMVDGSIHWTVDNGRGPITAVFKPNYPFELCNGEWHEIAAVKAKNVVTLSVDKIFARPGIGVPGVSATDTNNPLFLGGHPRPGRFSLQQGDCNFVGCMKDVVVEGNPVEITDDNIFGDIHSHVCPTI